MVAGASSAARIGNQDTFLHKISQLPLRSGPADKRNSGILAICQSALKPPVPSHAKRRPQASVVARPDNRGRAGSTHDAESQGHVAIDLFIQIDRLFEGGQHQARQLFRQGDDVPPGCISGWASSTRR
jgi:hypothetical protein